MTLSHSSTVPNPVALVVGGGLAGLATATLLARDHWKVTLLERSAHLGGRARSIDRDGYAFNLGPHAIYTGGAMSEVLADLGVDYGSRHGPKGIKTLHRGVFGAMPDSAGGLLRANALTLRDKAQLAGLMSALPKLDHQALGTISISAWIESLDLRPNVRDLFVALAMTGVYSTSLDLISADVLVEKTQRSMKAPIHYVDGGWNVIVEGLRHSAVAAGVEIVTGSRVAALWVENGRATAVETADGAEHTADCVVLAVEPAVAARLAPELLGELVAGLLPAKVACLDVALTSLPERKHPVVQDLDQPRFMSTQSSFAAVAPAGAALITSFKQLDARAPTDPDVSRRDLEDLLDTAQPGWRDLVVHEQFYPSISATGALPLATSGGLAGRPGPAVPTTTNLFLSGDWVGNEGFLSDACFASAKQAARLVGASLRTSPRAAP